MSNLLLLGLLVGGGWAGLRWLAAIRRQANNRWYDVLLALIAVLLVVVALTLDSRQGTQFDMGELLTVALGIVLFIPGLWVILVAEKPLASGGALAAAAGVILVVAAFAIPASRPAPQTTIMLPGATGPLDLPLSQTFSRSVDTVAFASFELPATADVPQAIPTLAQPAMIFATPSPVPTLDAQQPGASCTARVTARLNLRDQPSTVDGAVVTVVAYPSSVSLTARDATGTWWYMVDGTQTGWLYGEYLDRDDTCADLPVYND